MLLPRGDSDIDSPEADTWHHIPLRGNDKAIVTYNRWQVQTERWPGGFSIVIIRGSFLFKHFCLKYGGIVKCLKNMVVDGGVAGWICYFAGGAADGVRQAVNDGLVKPNREEVTT